MSEKWSLENRTQSAPNTRNDSAESVASSIALRPRSQSLDVVSINSELRRFLTKIEYGDRGSYSWPTSLSHQLRKYVAVRKTVSSQRYWGESRPAGRRPVGRAGTGESCALKCATHCFGVAIEGLSVDSIIPTTSPSKLYFQE